MKQKIEQKRKEQIGKGINEKIIQRGREINDRKREGNTPKSKKVYS